MAAISDILQAFAADAPPSVGEEGISLWEKRMVARFPERLRHILLRRDGGNLSPAFTISSGQHTVHMGRLLGIAPHNHGSIMRVSTWLDEIEHPLSSVPPSLFIFADDWDGNAITFDAASGEIGFMYHETMREDFADPETYYPIASTFDDFVIALRPGH